MSMSFFFMTPYARLREQVTIGYLAGPHTHFMRGRESNGRHRSSEGRRGPLEHPHPKIYFVLILSSLAIFHLRTPSLQQVPSVVLPRTVSSSSQRCRVGLQRPTLRKLDTSAIPGDFFARARRDIRDLPILVALSEGFCPPGTVVPCLRDVGDGWGEWAFSQTSQTIFSTV